MKKNPYSSEVTLHTKESTNLNIIEMKPNFDAAISTLALTSLCPELFIKVITGKISERFCIIVYVVLNVKEGKGSDYHLGGIYTK